MTIYKIFAIIMGILMVIICLVHARTKKDGVKNNLFKIGMLGILSILISIETYIHPESIMISIMSYISIIVWIIPSDEFHELNSTLKNEKQIKIVKRVDILYWFVTVIITITTSTISLHKSEILQAIFMVPIEIFGVVYLLYELYTSIKKKL